MYTEPNKQFPLIWISVAIWNREGLTYKPKRGQQVELLPVWLQIQVCQPEQGQQPTRHAKSRDIGLLTRKSTCNLAHLRCTPPHTPLPREMVSSPFDIMELYTTA